MTTLKALIGNYFFQLYSGELSKMSDSAAKMWDDTYTIMWTWRDRYVSCNKPKRRPGKEGRSGTRKPASIGSDDGI